MKGVKNMKIGAFLALLLVVCIAQGREFRTWTLADGTVFEAKYLFVVAKKVAMENRDGKQKKIALDRFSGADIELFELDPPPDLKISFRQKSSKMQYSDRFVLVAMPVISLYTFGVRVEKRSAGEYNHELTVEYFSIAAQRGFNDKYILVDYQTASFLPSKENNFSMEVWSPRVVNLDKHSWEWEHPIKPRGEKYKSYLIIITDKRGKVIAQKTPNKWLFENVEDLRKLSIGNYMDDTCKRVYPGRPKALWY